jgi:integrase
MGDDVQTSDEPKKRAAPQVLESKTFRDGAIYLYRRADYKKPTWFIRLKIPGAKGYVWKSSKSADEHVAYKVADDLFNQSLVKVLGGVNLSSKRIVTALEGYIRHLDSDKDRESVSHKILLARRLIPIFQKKTFGDLDTRLISKMVDDLTERSVKDKLSSNTIKRIFSDFRHFLSWCVREGYLDKLPAFPKVSTEKSRRPDFDPSDWRKLTRYMREFQKVDHTSVRRDRTLLVNYVLILANTGVRVGEARNLKWRDIRWVQNPDDPKDVHVVLKVRGKTGEREVVARTGEIKTYFARILELRRLDLKNPLSDIYEEKEVPVNSHIFCGVDGKPILSFKKSFISLIDKAGVTYDTFGQRRSIYSLRHTYATFRLQEGVNQYTLARNMGTSVAMLELFYGHNSNVGMATELTKMRKGGGGGGAKQTNSFDWMFSE